MKSTIYILSAILFAFSFQSCFNYVKGDGNIIEKEIDISDYKEFIFQMRGEKACNIIYEQKSDTPAYLKMITDGNIFDLFKIESDSNTLSIMGIGEKKFSPTKLEIYTNSPAIAKLMIMGNVKTHLKGKINSPDLTIEFYGVGNITTDSLICNKIVSEIYGMSNVILTGRTNSFESHINGMGKTKAFELDADSVFCYNSGMGTTEVYPKKYLKVELSGMGKVKYKGNPTLDQEINGAGKIEKIN